MAKQKTDDAAAGRQRQQEADHTRQKSMWSRVTSRTLFTLIEYQHSKTAVNRQSWDRSPTMLFGDLFFPFPKQFRETVDRLYRALIEMACERIWIRC
ncbi:hypothetical protein [Catenulispora yoronensis]|uniref:hypothetical protein n=1 Tax=Catenulispora yoronensis TaxID=450799 RepID=UPI0031E1E4D7